MLWTIGQETEIPGKAGREREGCDASSLVRTLGFSLDGLEVRGRKEVAKGLATGLFPSETGLLIVDDDRLLSPAAGGSVRKQLNLAVALQHDEPRDGRLN